MSNKYNVRDKNLPTILANSSNQSRPGVTIWNASKQNFHGKFHILYLETKHLETLKHILEYK